MKDKKLQKL